MKTNKNRWLKFGCFLTGYNYNIMKNSSEASAKAVKKYTSAILIVSIIWGFIGFSFSNRYLQLETLGSTIGAIIMVFIVIQIEKQIILNVGSNKVANRFRVAIALVMAILGSVIIDQIIFKDDIEIQKELALEEKVKKALPGKVSEINNEIGRLDSLLMQKSVERSNLIAEVTNNPTIKMPVSTTIKRPVERTKIIEDENGNYKTIAFDTIITENTYVTQHIVNPKASLVQKLDEQIMLFQDKREKQVNRKIGIREKLEEDFKSKFGFLDELEMMMVILIKSPVALVVWGLWFLFLVSIELFVVSSKWGNNSETDYDVTIIHQRDVRKKAIIGLTNTI